MWKNKHGSGIISPADLLQQSGVAFFECDNQDSQKALQQHICVYAARFQAKITCRKLHAFDAAGEPHYLLRVEVLKSGAEATRRIVDKRQN